MKYLLILLTAFAVLSLNAEVLKKESPQKPELKRPDAKPFPPHWGKPPAVQTKDIRPLPHGFGMGSSTLAKWISENLKEDAKKKKEKAKPAKPVDGQKPKPIPPIQPIRPEPPKEIKEKIELHKKIQDSLRKGLKQKIDGLGKGATKEEVRKAVEEYRKKNAERIEDASHIGKQIHEWQKENRPERPKRPEPSIEVKAQREAVMLAAKNLNEARNNLRESLKGKSREESAELIKTFKESQKEKYSELKAAQKELAKLVRERVQTKERRE